MGVEREVWIKSKEVGRKVDLSLERKDGSQGMTEELLILLTVMM